MRIWRNRKSHPFLVGMQNGRATLEDIWQFLTKLNLVLPYNPAVVLLDLHPNELKSYIHTKTCTWMFIAAFVIITQTWKQARYALVGKWRKLRYLL